MKLVLSTLLIVVILYGAGFVVLRSRLHSSGTAFSPTGLVNVQQTSIWIPSSGLERPLKQALYWVFYPAGQLDQLLTGQVYSRIDATNVLVLKLKHARGDARVIFERDSSDIKSFTAGSVAVFDPDSTKNNPIPHEPR